MKTDLVSVTEASKIKATTRQTIYSAIERGDIDGTEISGRTVVVCNKRWQEWQPQMIGGRVVKQQNEGDK